jgi:hypothetical protein
MEEVVPITPKEWLSRQVEVSALVARQTAPTFL